MSDLPRGVPTEPIPAEQAYAIRDRLREDPEQSAILLPPIEEFQGHDDPDKQLYGLRLIAEGVSEAIGGAVAHDVAEGWGSAAISGTCVQIENALATVYGEEPRLLARLFVQVMLDDQLARQLPPEEPTDV